MSKPGEKLAAVLKEDEANRKKRKKRKSAKKLIDDREKSLAQQIHDEQRRLKAEFYEWMARR